MLGRMFDCAGSMEKVLQDTYVIITSDHGHCEILADRDCAAICLDQQLDEFRQATLGTPWKDGDEVMICPNMRANADLLSAVGARPRGGCEILSPGR